MKFGTKNASSEDEDEYVELVTHSHRALHTAGRLELFRFIIIITQVKMLLFAFGWISFSAVIIAYRRILARGPPFIVVVVRLFELVAYFDS